MLAIICQDIISRAKGAAVSFKKFNRGHSLGKFFCCNCHVSLLLPKETALGVDYVLNWEIRAVVTLFFSSAIRFVNVSQELYVICIIVKFIF